MFVNLIHFIYILSLVCWVGSIVFFSFFVAPLIFRLLDRDKAGQVVSDIFPRYYLLGYVCAALISPSLLISTESLFGIKQTFLLIMILGWLCAGLFVNPKARDIKAKLESVICDEEQEPLEAKFKTLHSLAVKLNGLVLFAGLGLLWLSSKGLQL